VREKGRRGVVGWEVEAGIWGVEGVESLLVAVEGQGCRRGDSALDWGQHPGEGASWSGLHGWFGEVSIPNCDNRERREVYIVRTVAASTRQVGRSEG